MKKMTIVLVFAFLLTFIPFCVSAEDTEQAYCKAVISKAVAVFPEYAEKLLNPSAYSSTNSYSTESVLVVKETRPFSDYESISYAEYSNGLILLSDYEFSCWPETIPIPGNGYVNYTSDITAMCICGTYTGLFYLTGVTYTIRTGLNNFDSITSCGTPTRGQNCTRSQLDLYSANESNYGYATLSYGLQFRIGPNAGQVVTSFLTLTVGEDTAILDHYGWN